MHNSSSTVSSPEVPRLPDRSPSEQTATMPTTQTENAPADSWEEAADAATPSPSRETPPTPDDDDLDEEELEKKKKKKKVIDEEDSTEKKEPVNVIFIGHVGKYIVLISL